VFPTLTDDELLSPTGGAGLGSAVRRFATGYKFDLDVNRRVLEMGPIGSRFAALFGGLDQMKNADYITNGTTAYFKANPPPWNPKGLFQRLRDHFAK
jgi:hypothetical protein